MEKRIEEVCPKHTEACLSGLLALVGMSYITFYEVAQWVVCWADTRESHQPVRPNLNT